MKQKKQKIAFPITLKFTLVFIIILGLALTAGIIVNRLFLERYHIQDKITTMVNAYDELVRLFEEKTEDEAETESTEDAFPSIGFPNPYWSIFSSSSSDIQRTINRLQEVNGISVLIYTTDENESSSSLSVWTSSGVDFRWIYNQYLQINGKMDTATPIYDDGKIQIYRDYDTSSIFDADNRKSDTGRKGNWGEAPSNAFPTASSEDPAANFLPDPANNLPASSYEAADCLFCGGTINDNTGFFMRLSVTGISENAELSNRFYLYVGLIVMVLGSLAIFILTRWVTRPIVELTEVSRKMSELDFSVKYEGNTRDELNVLGTNMNEMSERLEHALVDLRSANLELKKDIAAKEEAEQRRSEFISNITHELKTPIALISGYAEGLGSGIASTPEDTAYYCDVIMDEAAKMNRMVKRLLNLSQLESGSNQMVMEQFDMAELVRGVAHSMDLVLEQKKIRLVLSITEPLSAWGDETYIEEVLSNYLSNAINHIDDNNEQGTDTGKADRYIEITAAPKDKGCVVSVFNTGSSIPEEELTRIWEKFYKVDKARTRAYGGNGIGLSIVRAILESHGGSFGAENREKGVSFWFYLPGADEV